MVWKGIFSRFQNRNPSLNLFYYPYSSISEKQRPILNTVALYYDKLYILNPMDNFIENNNIPGQFENRLREHITNGRDIINEISELQAEKIFEVLGHEKLLLDDTYRNHFKIQIYNDLNDKLFAQTLSEAKKRHNQENLTSWIMAHHKIPNDLFAENKISRNDQDKIINDMRIIISADHNGELLKEESLVEVNENLLSELGVRDFGSPAQENSFNLGPGDPGYRINVAMSLRLGESIMINHALHTALLRKNAFPITDDPLHDEMFKYKLNKYLKEKIGQRALNDEQQLETYKANVFPNDFFLTDLSIIPMQLQLKDILKFRKKNSSSLNALRKNFAKLSKSLVGTKIDQNFEKKFSKAKVDVINSVHECRTNAKNYIRENIVNWSTLGVQLGIKIHTIPSSIGLDIIGFGWGLLDIADKAKKNYEDTLKIKKIRSVRYLAKFEEYTMGIEDWYDHLDNTQQN